jgi:hypothetical protein
MRVQGTVQGACKALCNAIQRGKSTVRPFLESQQKRHRDDPAEDRARGNAEQAHRGRVRSLRRDAQLLFQDVSRQLQALPRRPGHGRAHETRDEHERRLDEVEMHGIRLSGLDAGLAGGRPHRQDVNGHRDAEPEDRGATPQREEEAVELGIGIQLAGFTVVGFQPLAKIGGRGEESRLRCRRLYPVVIGKTAGGPAVHQPARRVDGVVRVLNHRRSFIYNRNGHKPRRPIGFL